MIAAVIDLGTNTFHLVIAKITADGIQVIYKTNLPVKLGEGRINDNIIIPEAYARGLQALQGFNREIEKYQVDVVKAIATSAIRSAANEHHSYKRSLCSKRRPDCCSRCTT